MLLSYTGILLLLGIIIVVQYCRLLRFRRNHDIAYLSIFGRYLYVYYVVYGWLICMEICYMFRWDCEEWHKYMGILYDNGITSGERSTKPNQPKHNLTNSHPIQYIPLPRFHLRIFCTPTDPPNPISMVTITP